MTLDEQLVQSIRKSYDSIQAQFCVEPGPAELSGAVTFSNNQSAPVHRWFVFKEGFGANILGLLSLEHCSVEDREAVFMDPFCGSGTTILSSDIQYGWRCRRIGIEVNPFIAFVARTKTNWRAYDRATVEEYAQTLLEHPLDENIPEAEWPNLSTLRNPEMFDRRKVSQLLDAVRRSQAMPRPYSDLFLLGVAAVVEKLSLYRKTGRALRRLTGAHSLEQRRHYEAEAELRAVWLSFARDVQRLSQLRTRECSDPVIIRADGRNLSDGQLTAIGRGSVSLMVYSPPYLNHIDYTEVYKVESWLLGFTASAETMRAQRLETVRSHSSVQFPESRPRLSPAAREALRLVSKIVSKGGDPWHRKFPATARGYLSDMQMSLRTQFRLLEPGGQVRCVVGNSAHGSKGRRIAVATDLFIADIAKRVGFEVSKIQVARALARRDHLNSYLRESVIWMRKPISTSGSL